MNHTRTYAVCRLIRLVIIVGLVGWLVVTAIHGLAAATHKAERRIDSRMDLIERAVS